jgi:nitrite reductase/ring-hydroxylating ferredoxin subunit
MAEIVFGEISEIEPDKVNVKRFGRNKVAVVIYDNNYYAFKNMCTHADVSLSDGILCEKSIECTMHGAKFDFTNGEVLKAPAIRPLEVYKTRIEDNKILVDILD